MRVENASHKCQRGNWPEAQNSRCTGTREDFPDGISRTPSPATMPCTLQLYVPRCPCHHLMCYFCVLHQDKDLLFLAAKYSEQLQGAYVMPCAVLRAFSVSIHLIHTTPQWGGASINILAADAQESCPACRASSTAGLILYWTLLLTRQEALCASPCNHHCQDF